MQILASSTEEVDPGAEESEKEDSIQQRNNPDLFQNKWDTLKKHGGASEEAEKAAVDVNTMPEGSADAPPPGESSTTHTADSLDQMAVTYVKRQDNKRNLQQIFREWQAVIHVIDRALLYAFTAATVNLFTSHPSFSKLLTAFKDFSRSLVQIFR